MTSLLTSSEVALAVAVAAVDVVVQVAAALTSISIWAVADSINISKNNTLSSKT